MMLFHAIDATSESFSYGAGADANLLVSQDDRLGNTTTFEHDASGRQTKRTTAANDSAVAGWWH